jgi:drug/metabolite transporter (DMT)-like permease
MYNCVTKWVLSGTTKADPLAFSLLRDVIAFPLLEIGALLVDGRLIPAKTDLPMLAALGLLGMFGNQFLFIYGLSDKSVSATLAAVLSQTQPSWLLGAGVLLAFGGAAVMARVWSSEIRSADELLHLGALLLGALCMAGYYVAQAPVLRRIPPLTLTACLQRD